MDDPVEALYTALGGLATGGKRVQVAEEPDGSLYGPAVFRVHYAGHEYAPHINHEGEDDRSQTFLELRGLSYRMRCCAGIFMLPMIRSQSQTCIPARDMFLIPNSLKRL